MNLLARFPGYTLRTLLEEDAELLGLLAVADRGRPPEQDPGAPGMGGW